MDYEFFFTVFTNPQKQTVLPLIAICINTFYLASLSFQLPVIYSKSLVNLTPAIPRI
jgi:hypothetical protein